MPNSFNTSNYIIQDLKWRIGVSNEALRTGKKDTMSQTVSDIYSLNKYKSKIADLRNDSNSLAKSRSLISSNSKSVQNLQEKLAGIKNIATQVASSTDEKLTQSLLSSINKNLKDYDAQAIGLGFNGTKGGAPKITTTGSNELSTIDASNLNPAAAADVFGRDNRRNDISRSFTLITGSDNRFEIKVKIGDTTITEKYTGTTGSDSNEGNTFFESANPLVKAQNVASSILKATKSSLRDIFNIKVLTGVDAGKIKFTPKNVLSNFSVEVNNRDLPLNAVGADIVDAVEMRVLSKTSDKALDGFSNTSYALIGEIAGANNQAKSTTTILHTDLINGATGGGNAVVGALASAVGGATNANVAIYNRLLAMNANDLQTIMTDLKALHANSTNGLGINAAGRWGGVAAAGNSHIEILRTKITGLRTANLISNQTENLLNNNFFADKGGRAENAADTTLVYGSANGNDGADSIFGNNVHSTNVAQNVIRDINKLVTNAYFRKMIDTDHNGIISESARLELTQVGIAGSQLDATAGSLLHTVKTRYNGKDYIGITGGNGNGDLDAAGRSIFFFEADGNFIKPNAEIAFKVHFQDRQTIAGVAGAAGANPGILQGLLDGKTAKFRIGMTEPSAAAHVTIKGKDLSNYSYVSSANMVRSGDNVVLSIGINNTTFTCTSSIGELNSLGIGDKLDFVISGGSAESDSIQLTINDPNNTAKRLFKDSEGKEINNDNFEEIASKFTEFFNGEALKFKTSAGIEIDVEQNDLRTASIMDYSKISDINKDNIGDFIAEIEKAESAVISELSGYSTANEIVDSNIKSTTIQMKFVEGDISSIEDADMSNESKNLQTLMRTQSIINKITNVIDSYDNNTTNELLRTLQDNVRSMS